MRVGVLGGGLQGVCVALELAANGVEVDLYERSERPLSRASAHNEGKIHLGYVYANDATRRSARTMARGAVCFQFLLRRWLGNAIDSVPVSAPFDYVVHRDSLLKVSEIEAHLAATHQIVLEESERFPLQYFGRDYRVGPVPLGEAARRRHYARRSILAAYSTSEIAIDTKALADLLRLRLSEEKNIHCSFQTEVRAVRPTHKSATVEFERGGERERRQYDHVVNTLWDGRLAIDQTAGLAAPRPWIYRVKYFLRLASPANGAALPTTTIVLGPFGDIVRYGNNETFLSWYPAGMKGISSQIKPPPWPLSLAPEAATEMREKILAGLAEIIPAAGNLSPESLKSCRVEAGVIFAWGSTDIPDRASGLHERHAVGPVSHGRYHSVDTGKLTMAPCFGKMVADRILGKESDVG